MAEAQEPHWAFRCGWCGMPCGADGEALGDDAPTTDGETQHVNGNCCPGGDDEDRMVQASREMALDAGDQGLEGRWIPW